MRCQRIRLVAGAAALLGALRVPDNLRVGAFTVGVVLVLGAAAAFAILRRRQGLAPLSLTAATAFAYGVAAVSILPAVANAAYPYPALGRLVAEKSSPWVALGSIGAIGYFGALVSFRLMSVADAVRGVRGLMRVAG